MGYKLHRSHRSVFRRKRTWPRVLLSLFAALVVVAGGFFAARWLDRPKTELPTDTSATVSTPATESDPETPPQELPPATVDTVKGFWLPHSALLDTDALTATLEKAADAGLNTLLFNLKDGDGHLYYRFESPQAVQVNSFKENALTGDQLAAVLDAAKAAGLQVIPRLYAFRDNAAARVLAGARIAHESDPGWVWYDADPKNGGKAWLNPYADEAHLYLISLAEELKSAGVAGILLDGVQFPTNDYSASFGSSANTAMARGDILTAFVDKVQAALGSDCPVLLGAEAEASLGTDTTVYGGNPLTFGADQAVPRIKLTSMPASITIGESVISISPDKPRESVEAAVHHMVLRLKVAEGSTTLTPWLHTDDLSAADLKAQLEGCKSGGTEAFILYHTKGKYDFTALS